MATLYEVLGVSSTVDEMELKRAYRRRQRETHPDVTGGSSEQFRRVQEAWETLGEPGKRAAYDESLRRPTNFTSAGRPVQEDMNMFYQAFAQTGYMQRMAEELRRIEAEERARQRRLEEQALQVDELLQPSFPFYGRLVPQYYRWYASAFAAGVDYRRVRIWKFGDSLSTVLGLIGLGLLSWFTLQDPANNNNGVSAVGTLLFLYGGVAIVGAFSVLMVWGYRWGRWVLGPHFRRLRPR